MCFPLIRWKQLEYAFYDIDKVVHCLSHSRYVSLKRHIGGNAYVSAESPALIIDIRDHWLSPIDLFMPHLMDFEQYHKLNDVDKVLPTLLSELRKHVALSVYTSKRRGSYIL